MGIVLSVMLLFAGIGVLIVIHICIVGRAFRRGIGNGGMADREGLGSASMSRDDIEKLPSFSYRDKAKGSSPVGCAVCLENLKAGDKCRLLPLCKHSFHADCVDVWLLRTPMCPICRASADYRNSGLNFDEEIGHFSESGAVESGDNQATETGNLNEAAVESAENQETESGHPMNASIELIIPASAESTQLNDSSPNERSAAEDGNQVQTVTESSQSLAEDNGHDNEAFIEMRGSTHRSEDQQTLSFCS